MTNPIIGLFLPFATIVLSQLFVVTIMSYDGRIVVQPQTVLEEPFSYPKPKATFVTKLRLDWDEKNKRMVYEEVGSGVIYSSASDFLKETFWWKYYLRSHRPKQETWLEIGANVPYCYLDSVLAVQPTLNPNKIFFLAKHAAPLPFRDFFNPYTGIKTNITNPDSLSTCWKNIQMELNSILLKYNRISPPPPPTPDPPVAFETYKIAITKQGSTINGKSYDLKTWKKFWQQYFKQPKNNTELRLSLELKFYTAPNVPYQEWLEAFSSIVMARRQRLEEVSDFMFGQEHDSLSNEQKSLVSNVISSINFSFYVLE